MRKFCFSLFLFLAIGAWSTNASANVFPAHLELGRNGSSYIFRYRLNEPATEVTIEVKGPKPSDAIIETISGTTQKGLNEVHWDGIIEGGAMLWEGVYDWVVSATDSVGHSAAFDLLSDDTATTSKYFHPCGVDVNNNQDSDYFGCIYVSESQGGSVAGRTTSQGVFILNNDLSPFSDQANSGYSVGTTWATWFSPMRVRLDAIGNVFLSDWMDSHSGIWKSDPECEGDFLPVLTENGRTASGLCSNHGTVMGFWLDGSGSNLDLYTLDEDYTVGTETTGSILKYAVCDALEYNVTPTIIYNDKANGDLIVNSRSQLVKDETGWWIAQYQASQTPSRPWLIHWNGTSVDYNSASASLAISSCYGALDIDPKGERLLVGGFGSIALLDISHGVFSVSAVGEIIAGGDHVQDVSFDPAGNMLQVNTALQRLRVYSPNDGPNSYSTTCRASQRLRTGNSSSIEPPYWRTYR